MNPGNPDKVFTVIQWRARCLHSRRRESLFRGWRTVESALVKM